jgi:hypothetical protein
MLRDLGSSERQAAQELAFAEAEGGLAKCFPHGTAGLDAAAGGFLRHG